MQRPAHILAALFTLFTAGTAHAFVRTPDMDSTIAPPEWASMGAATNSAPLVVTPPAATDASHRETPPARHLDFAPFRGGAFSSALDACRPARAPRCTAELRSLDERDATPPRAQRSPSARTAVLLTSIFMTPER
jgi:hypothetical protein